MAAEIDATCPARADALRDHLRDIDQSVRDCLLGTASATSPLHSSWSCSAALAQAPGDATRAAELVQCLSDCVSLFTDPSRFHDERPGALPRDDLLPFVVTWAMRHATADEAARLLVGADGAFAVVLKMFASRYAAREVLVFGQRDA